jgi:alanine racemase
MHGLVIGELTISLGALRDNAQLLRDLAGAQRTAFVVKGNAYGHGLVPVARAVEPYAARLCVYTVDEGLTLRSAGISAPILVLGPIPASALGDALDAALEIAVWNRGEFVRSLDGLARARDTTASLHVKVNTDLNRLGVEPHELRDVVERLSEASALRIAGIFSHLASAEELDSPYTARQLDAFERGLEEARPVLERQGVRPLRHIAASAAAMLWPHTRMDMTRFGIALYGLWPSQQTREALGTAAPQLRAALTYRSKLVATRTIESGASVGYGGSFRAPREMRIGVVPAGYADGVPRVFSNRGAFAVDGARCPIVGRVAMNMTEIDLTAAPNARPGSVVTLIGRDGDVAITADDWAQWAETINYEIVTRLPAELPRTYVED